jgi:molybdopterin-guanine dinucleotide biosynthesis protein A
MLPHVPAAAILTGGLARRFHGRDKSRLVVNAAPILDHQLAALAPIASDILIVTSTDRAASFAAAGARVVLDAHPGRGPLGAIVTALDATDAPSLIVLAGDMPHVSGPLLSALVRLHEPGGHDAAVPESSRGLEPLCAVYGRSARAALAAALASGDLSMQHALRGLRLGVMRAADVASYGDPEAIFRNINAPEDL